MVWFLMKQQWLQDLVETSIIQQIVQSSVTIILENWNLRGIDKIHNDWCKNLSCTHVIHVKQFKQVLSDPEVLPGYVS